jgi:hypothetical protein
LKKDEEMKTYAMFSKAGDAAVSKIVEAAAVAKLSWNTVEAMLCALSNENGYREAFDTEVRETVYIELFKVA